MEVLQPLLTGAGQDRARAAIMASGQPSYASDPKDATGVIKVWPDGRQVRGHFVGRKLVPIE